MSQAASQRPRLMNLFGATVLVLCVGCASDDSESAQTPQSSANSQTSGTRDAIVTETQDDEFARAAKGIAELPEVEYDTLLKSD